MGHRLGQQRLLFCALSAAPLPLMAKPVVAALAVSTVSVVVRVYGRAAMPMAPYGMIVNVFAMLKNEKPAIIPAFITTFYISDFPIHLNQTYRLDGCRAPLQGFDHSRMAHEHAAGTSLSTTITYIYVAVCHVLDGGDGETTAAIHEYIYNN